MRRGAKVVATWATVAISAGVLVAAATPAAAITVERIAGGDRYETAAAVSQGTFPAGTATVYVATGESFPDALAAGPAAAHAEGPVLLTRRADLPASVASELQRLAPGDIVLVGGEHAVGSGVEAALDSYAPVDACRRRRPRR